MKVGIGFSLQPDPRRAGQQAAREALRTSGPLALTFLFTTDSYDQVVTTLGGKGLRVATSLQRGLSRDPYAAGCAAGEELLTMGADFRYIGGAAGDNLRFFKTYQFTEVAIDSDALAVALLDGVAIGTAIDHGWKGTGGPSGLPLGRRSPSSGH